MSEMTETITLRAPKVGIKEHHYSKPQECPHCGGRGHFTPDGPNDEAPKCEHCAGTGKLQAIVDIAWVPANRWHAHGAPRTDWEINEQTRRKITRR